MNRIQAETLAMKRIRREMRKGVDYAARHSAIEGAWYVARYEGGKEVERIYADVECEHAWETQPGGLIDICTKCGEGRA